MNRIPYPEKKEINRQIHLILDHSGIFEETDKNQAYMECVQLKHKPILKTAIIFPMATAAVVFLAVALTKMLPIPSNSNAEPMTNVITDDTIRTAEKISINENIMVEMCTSSMTLAGNQAYDVEITCNYPKVYYRGEEVAEISDYYQNKMLEITETAREKYGYIDEIETMEEKDMGGIVKILYNCSVVRGISSEENTLVTIYENYSENVNYDNEYITINEAYGSNFDAKDGHRILLDEIFYNTDIAFEDLSVYLQGEAYLSQMMEKDAASIEWYSQDLDILINNDAWYFGTNGLTLCINDIQGEKESYAGAVYQNYYSESIVIPYSSLSSLKLEYRNEK